MSAELGLARALGWKLVVCASIAALISVGLAGCSEKAYRDKVYDTALAVDAGPGEEPEPGAPDDAGPTRVEPLSCKPAASSDHLPPRASVMSSNPRPSAEGVFTSDLFNLFRSHCGGCHVDQGLGDLKVTLQNFPTTVTRQVLSRIRSDNPDEFMPPVASAGKPYSERGPSDPVVELAKFLDAWLEAGSPVDVFYPAVEGGTGSDPFAISRDVGSSMTNLGNCIPSTSMVASEKKKSAELDAMFEKAEALPERLEDTDLVSLDSEVLARYGVVAFAPTYTLWADDAKKIRLVRVPRGTSIKFDKATQQFDIPPNTRFYKTFLKRVIDHRGNESYRKLETRLIVSRPDKKLPDGSYVEGSLHGTYAWNESETEAVLLRDPLRNGKPWRDRLVTYITDEQAAEKVLAQGPENLQKELEERGLSRTWALPGIARCQHCHMGAPNKSFVLGFTPLQLYRRPLGEGGVIEPAAEDELGQLQRLIDYGLISGMKSPKDVLLLEDGQGERKARNQQELEAQGYMLGNCAHCHNPYGFPSRVAPELRDVLDFYPSETGGIFQFPLDRTSPRITRGPLLNQPMPYVSPGLYDVPSRQGMEDASAKVIGKPGCTIPPGGTAADCYQYLPAPWRSLIYRNVDTPFSYTDDSAIFPHMPMDTAGYDCRARRLLGTWMVSIPVAWKYDEYVPAGANTPPQRLPEWQFTDDGASSDPQPYIEILPDDPAFAAAQRAAGARAKTFAASSRFNDCPPSSLDIVDPRVVRGEEVVPGPTLDSPMLGVDGKPLVDVDGKPLGFYSLPVPSRGHFADTDLTQAPGDWYPRRPDWDDVLVADHDQVPAATPKEAKVVELLQQVRITEELRSLALTDVPFGLWQVKEGCDFSSQETVSDFSPTERPIWMLSNPFLKGTEPVYGTSAGSMVFTSICQNCHGPKGDSLGRLAATIADMTGGQTRVANLRDGLFGPEGQVGVNIARAFGDVAGAGLTAEDWAARYVLWMGLGGTQRVIPPAALTAVGNTRILGLARPAYISITDANMLSVAAGLCNIVMMRNNMPFDAATGRADYARSALIPTNGDAEMWERLCTFGNPLPVLKVELAGEHLRGAGGVLYARGKYPQDAAVGHAGRGVTTGIQADNPAPFCFKREVEASSQAKLERVWRASVAGDAPVPYCPDSILSQELRDEEREPWALRGALTAGLSVFLYLEALLRGETQPPIPFDRCEELGSK